jgi:hypothetical protein
MAILPVFLLSKVGIAWISGEHSDPWRIIVLVQTVGTCVLATALQVSGHRIEPAENGAAKGGARPIQFSIRDLLIATMAVAFMVPIMH